MGAGGRRAAARRRQAATTDPYWTNVVFMQNWNNTTPDATGKTVTLVGNASVSGGNLILDGTGTAGTFDSASFSLTGGIGSGDFAIEAFVTLTNPLGKTDQAFFGTTNWASGGAWFFQFNGGGAANLNRLGYYNASSSSSTAKAVSDTFTFPTNTSTWVCLSRTSGVVEGYVDGVRLFSVADTTNFTQTTITPGAYTYAGMAGSHQATRITKGSNHGYTGTTVVVPTLPFPSS